VGQVQKPHVEKIEGLSPAVALEQKNLGHSPRSTVGTVTEVYDYLRILMARLGVMHCPDCQVPVGTQTPDQIVEKVMAMPVGTRALVLAPIEVQAGEASRDTWQSLRSTGYQRIRIDGRTIALDDAKTLDPRKRQVVQVVVDRIAIEADDRTRITDSVEQALSLGVGVLQIAVADEEREEPLWKTQTHSQHLVCGCCGRSFSELTPHHFSFNTAIGWCPQCEGLGTQTGTNPAALVTSTAKTLAEGAALLWPEVQQSVSGWMLNALSRHTGIPIDVPFDALTVSQRRILFRGTGPQWIEVRESDKKGNKKSGAILFRYQFKGFYPALDEASRLTPGLRGKLEQFTAEIDCSVCDGSRLTDEAAAVRFRGHTIADLVHMPLDRLHAEAKSWKFDRRERKIAGELVREVRARVGFLLDVGLNYLTMHRGASTLSGGEAQRIRLAAQLGSGLCGVLYVLDEPTIGLHPRDNQRLIGALHRLRDLGNTLLVVEHDREVIDSSDYLCDFGPRAGRHGGRIVAKGKPGEVEPYQDSVTAGFIDGSKKISCPASRRPVYTESGTPMVDFIKVLGATENNLQSVDFELPLGVFTAITGPSGSGKSSLIEQILYPVLARRLHRSRTKPGRHDKVEGLRYIDKVIRVDQSPLGNTPSSNPATYTGVFDLIRQLYASIPLAAERRYTARTFSFNVPGGRCETCEGSGQLKIEMHFLPDVWVPCEECDSRRYNEDVLEVKLHGKSIADVLEMQCGEATELFANYPRILRTLQTLCDVGLEYVTLGQAAPTLSGGEAQRVKLAAELSRPMTGNTLYLLDEPTTGLHFDDIEKLLNVVQRLVEMGNSVVVIEHNLDVIKCADWIVDMGPGAGVDGGEIVFAGTPEQLAAQATTRRRKSTKSNPVSVTAPFLAKVLNADEDWQGKPETSTKPSRGGKREPVGKSRDLGGTDDSGSDTGNGSAEYQPPTKPAEKNAKLRPAIARVDPAEGSKKAASAKQRATKEVVTATQGRPKAGIPMTAQATGALEPWKTLGKKWHCLEKGFTPGEAPLWPLEVAERALKLLEQIAGQDALVFSGPDRFEVRPSGTDTAWAEVYTKEADALKITLAGPDSAFDSSSFSNLEMQGPVNQPEGQGTTITLNLTTLKHVRSRKLRTFMKSHLERTLQ
jgi:excinuclease ABC subunit A